MGTDDEDDFVSQRLTQLNSIKAQLKKMKAEVDELLAKQTTIETNLFEVQREVAVTLEPDDAFGEYEADLLRVEPRDRFPETLEKGMQFEGMPGERESEARIYTVTDVTGDKVVVDANHPLAGERLWFKGTVMEVRAATDEELRHGHVHGDFGMHPH